MNRPKTIFCDIDGTIFHHYQDRPDHQILGNGEIISGVRDKFAEWHKKDYHIILTTARKEGSRKLTEKQLDHYGIIYDKLIMGITGGQRVLINDLKGDSDEPTAIAICVRKNEGLSGVNV